VTTIATFAMMLASARRRIRGITVRDPTECSKEIQIRPRAVMSITGVPVCSSRLKYVTLS
jgi:hypothetical protein